MELYPGTIRGFVSIDACPLKREYYTNWEKRTGRKVHWIEDADHNSNCDAPDVVNALIKQFIESVSPHQHLLGLINPSRQYRRRQPHQQLCHSVLHPLLPT